jgi:hypothetical protein
MEDAGLLLETCLIIKLHLYFGIIKNEVGKVGNKKFIR